MMYHTLGLLLVGAAALGDWVKAAPSPSVINASLSIVIDNDLNGISPVHKDFLFSLTR